MTETGLVVVLKKAKIQAPSKLKGSEFVQEAWLSGQNALSRNFDLHPSFLILRISPRNNSDNDSQQNEEPEQTGKSHNAEPIFQVTITRSRARNIAARIPRTQQTD